MKKLCLAALLAAGTLSIMSGDFEQRPGDFNPEEFQFDIRRIAETIHHEEVDENALPNVFQTYKLHSALQKAKSALETTHAAQPRTEMSLRDTRRLYNRIDEMTLEEKANFILSNYQVLGILHRNMSEVRLLKTGLSSVSVANYEQYKNLLIKIKKELEFLTDLHTDDEDTKFIIIITFNRLIHRDIDEHIETVKSQVKTKAWNAVKAYYNVGGLIWSLYPLISQAMNSLADSDITNSTPDWM